MTRNEYLRQAIESYLDSPDTPSKARRRDWAIAGDFYNRGFALETVRHAVRLATLRRHRREADLTPLEPISSLAYFRRLIEYLHQSPHDPGYVEHVRWSCENRLDWPFPEGVKNSG